MSTVYCHKCGELKPSNEFGYNICEDCYEAMNGHAVRVVEVLEQQLKDSINFNPDELRGAFWVINRMKELM